MIEVRIDVIDEPEGDFRSPAAQMWRAVQDAAQQIGWDNFQMSIAVRETHVPWEPESASEVSEDGSTVNPLA